MAPRDEVRPARALLFLQGVASPFFPRLADRLKGEGVAVHRVNFCAGDACCWGARPAWSYRGRLAELSAYLRERIDSHRIDGLVLFGDRRPVHRAGIEAARAAGIRVHVFEEGYFRPHWVTLERGGTNADSPLPRDPAWFLDAAADLPQDPPVEPVRGSLAARAARDIAFHLGNLANPVLYPRYRTHWPFVAGVEYAGYARRFPLLGVWRHVDGRTIARLGTEAAPYFLLALQLDTDAQIVHHSRHRDMRAVIEEVLASFARFAPPQTVLVVKNHPLDTGLAPYRRIVGRLAATLGIRDRVSYLETGDLEQLLQRARGLVTVNSTSSLAALQSGCPVKVLGKAIYDLPGLTSQSSLDAFWHAPAAPDGPLWAAWRRVVIHATQVNGGFYTSSGIALAVRNAVPRLLAPRSPLECLLDAVPVRQGASP